jgi:AGZA family xanthine/uracil permease-like MFS transporter
MAAVAQIDWEDPVIAIPALLTIVLMPFTYSITNGVGAGFISFAALALVRGRWRDAHPLLLVIAGIFVWYFVHGVV